MKFIYLFIFKLSSLFKSSFIHSSISVCSPLLRSVLIHPSSHPSSHPVSFNISYSLLFTYSYSLPLSLSLVLTIISLDCFTLKPIYKGSPSIKCSYCGSVSDPSHKGSPCATCNLSTVRNRNWN